MTDYTWPSVYFAYLFFAISLGVGLYFFVRSWKDGYWGKDGEDIKYTVFDDAESREEMLGIAGEACLAPTEHGAHVGAGHARPVVSPLPHRLEGRWQAGRPVPHKD